LRLYPIDLTYVEPVESSYAINYLQKYNAITETKIILMYLQGVEICVIGKQILVIPLSSLS
jgi:hypothetical protein